MQQHTVSMGQRQFRIGDLADELKVKKFVIRFWEQEFKLFANRSEGGHRFYTTADLRTFQIIKDLLHNQGYTIEGARKQLPLLLKEQAPVEATPAVVNPAPPTLVEEQRLESENEQVNVAPVIEVAAPVIEIITEQVATEIPVLEVIASAVVEIVPEEEAPVSAFSVQPAVEAPVAAAETPHEKSVAQAPLTLSLPKNAPVEERESENWGAHVDEQTPVRTCHHEETHTPVSVAPCTTCEKHSRHLAFVKDELQELVKRLR